MLFEAITLSEVKKLYHSIGEVSDITGLKPYVLRYWETEFPNLSPSKNRAGNRVYTDRDIERIREIKKLLYQEKFTIEGARQYFKNQAVNQNNDADTAPETQVNMSRSERIRDRDIARQALKETLADLKELINMIRKER